MSQESNDVNNLVNNVEELIPLSRPGSMDGTDRWFTEGLFCAEIVPYLQTTMMGSIFFIRLPWIVAYCGLFLTLVLIVISMLTVSLTALTLGAVGSEQRMPAFSTLFALLEKNHGKELSSSICFIYFLAKCLSVTMYCLTAAEAALWHRGDYLPFNAYSHEKVVTALIICACLFLFYVMGKKRLMTFVGLAALVIVCVMWASAVVGAGVNFSPGGNHSTFIASKGPSVGGPSTQYHLYTFLGLVFPNFVGIIANLIRPEKLPQRQMPRPLGNILGVAVIGVVTIVVAAAYSFHVAAAEMRESILLIGKPFILFIRRKPLLSSAIVVAIKVLHPSRSCILRVVRRLVRGYCSGEMSASVGAQ